MNFLFFIFFMLRNSDIPKNSTKIIAIIICIPSEIEQKFLLRRLFFGRFSVFGIPLYVVLNIPQNVNYTILLQFELFYGKLITKSITIAKLRRFQQPRTTNQVDNRLEINLLKKFRMRLDLIVHYTLRLISITKNTVIKLIIIIIQYRQRLTSITIINIQESKSMNKKNIKNIIKYILIFETLSLLLVIKAEEQTTPVYLFNIDLSSDNKMQTQVFQEVNTNKQIAITFENQNMYQIQHKLVIEKKDDQYCKLTISHLHQKQVQQLKVCKITFSKDLCIIEKPPNQITVTVECLVNQCRGTFSIFQTSEIQLNPDQTKISDSGILAMNPSTNKLHRIVKIFCQTLNCKVRQQISVFSDNAIYAQFQNEEDNEVLLSYPQIDGHIFLVFSDQLKDGISVQIIQQKLSLLPFEQSLAYIPIQYNYSVNLYNNQQKNGYLNLELLIESVQTVAFLQYSFFTVQIVRMNQTVLLKQDIQISSQFKSFYYVNPIFQSNQNLTLKINSKTNNLFIKVQFDSSPFHSVSEFGQNLHFSLQKQKEIKFKYSIVSKGQPEDKNKVKYTYDQMTQSKIRQSQQNCDYKNNMKHCQFSIFGQEDCSFCTIKFEQQVEKMFFGKNFRLMLPHNKYQNFDSSQIIYLYYEMLIDEIISITVETQEVMIYSLTNPQVCPNQHLNGKGQNKGYSQFLPPGGDCYQEIGNFRNPIIVKNVKGYIERLYIAVKSESQKPIVINLNTIGQKYIPLFPQTPANYKLDQSMSYINFLYVHQSHDKQFDDLNLNLVGPLHQLKLAVYFQQEKINSYDDAIDYSLDGYLTISKQLFEKNDQNIDGRRVSYLYIKVQTADALRFLSQGQFALHFTLIASSKEHRLVLLEGQTHYDTMGPQDKQMFGFEFEKIKNYTFNFYIFNFPRQQKVEIQYVIKKMNQVGINSQKNSNQHKVFKISSSVSSFSLNKQLQHQCEQTSCELAIMIKNPMKVSIDFAITIFSKQSQIYLRDGQWQSYSEILLRDGPIHFYYVPISNKTVNLFYKTVNNNIKVQYKVHTFNEDQQKILKMKKWPFPKPKDTLSQNRRSQRNIRIQQVKQCFPNCLILISVFEVSQVSDQNIVTKEEIDQKGRSYNNNFKIMVSTTIIQLQQKQAFPMFLQPNKKTYVLIDMKYLMNRKYITFFTKYVTGFVEPAVSLYSSKHNGLPQSKQKADFIIDRNEYALALKDIKSKKVQKQFGTKQDFYLVVLFEATEQTILNFQYNAEENSQIRTLHIDSYESVFFQANGQLQQQRTLEFVPIRNYQLRVNINGIDSDKAFIKLIECSRLDEVTKCLSENRNKTNTDRQSKLKKSNGNFYYEGQACQQCYNFIWVSSKFTTNLTISLQSTNKSIILREKQTFVDSVKIGGTNYYQIPISTAKSVFMNVNLLQGGIKLVINAQQNLNYKQYYLSSLNRAQQSGSVQNVSIQLPPIHQQLESSKQNLKQQTFSRYFIAVKGISSKQVNRFQIFYSIQQEQIYINQGTIIQQKLEPQVSKKINFHISDIDKPAYLTISCLSNDLLVNPFANIELRIFIYEQINGETNKRQFPVQIPYDANPNHHMNQKLTKTISLPRDFNFYQIFLKNTKMTQSITVKLMMNNGGDIYLPHNQEISWQLMPSQTVNIISQSKVNQHQKYILRKCGQDQLQISYGFGIFEISKSKQVQYTSFNPGVYQLAIQNEQNNDQSITLFIKNKQTTNEAVFSLKIVDRTIGQHLQVNKGDNSVEYNIKGINKFQILFNQVSCYEEMGSKEKVNCSTNIIYYALAVPKKQDLLKPMYCPHHQFFGIKNSRILQIQTQKRHFGAQFKQIKPVFNKEQGRLQYLLQLDVLKPTTKQFLGIKAINRKNSAQFFYDPLQIVTVQSFFSILDVKAFAFVIISVLALMTGFAFIVTKQARRGYQPIAVSIDQESIIARH